MRVTGLESKAVGENYRTGSEEQWRQRQQGGGEEGRRVWQLKRQRGPRLHRNWGSLPALQHQQHVRMLLLELQLLKLLVLQKQHSSVQEVSQQPIQGHRLLPPLPPLLLLLLHLQRHPVTQQQHLLLLLLPLRLLLHLQVLLLCLHLLRYPHPHHRLLQAQELQHLLQEQRQRHQQLHVQLSLLQGSHQQQQQQQ